MTAMLEAIATAIADHTPLPPGARVLVGLSGGPDSMVLLHALKALGYVVEGGHLDHGWRPDSATEAEWLAARCQEWGVPYHTARVTVGVSEEAARAARHTY